jgi:hypothetical protein
MIDFAVFTRVAEIVATAVVGGLIHRFFEQRARVVAFYGHVGEFHLQPIQPGQVPTTVHTHTVVVRNTGKLPAHNVRLPHTLRLAAPGMNVSVYPQTNYTTNQLPTGGEEILVAVLPSGQQLTVSYLYFAPLTFHHVNQPISSDEGMAQVLNVLPMPRLPAWQTRTLWTLVAIGAVTVAYFVVELGLWTYSVLNAR